MEENKCTVHLDGEVRESTDYVAILANEEGGASITYNTDALTMGFALKMVAKAFVDMSNECSEEEVAELQSILGTAFFKEATK